jgi:hypothetical protein
MSAFSKFSLFTAGALGFLLIGSPLGAQSGLVTSGLGVEIEPLDARSRGMGGVSVGLTDPEISWFNTAASVGLAVPGIIFSYQYDNFDSTLAGDSIETDSRTARFPLILAVFPVSDRLTLTAGYGSFLDQSWSLQREERLGFSSDSVDVIDVVSSQGGVARLRLGAAYGVLSTLSIGIAGDAYTGEVQRVQGRRFGFEPTPACCRSVYNYSGFGVSGSVQWNPSEAIGVGASVSHGGTLDAEIVVDTTSTQEQGTDRSYELPLQVRGGVTGRVGQATIVALGGKWDGWSKLNDSLASSGGARDTWAAQAGVEWEGLVIRDRPVPVRLGGRTGTLPFRSGDSADSGWTDERALTLGAGLVLANGAARSDLAFEFGERAGDESAFSESFWRFAFSVRVLGR